MSRYQNSSRKPQIFFLLMLLSAISMFLPAQWMDGFKGVTQLLVALQGPAYRFSQWVSDGTQSWTPVQTVDSVSQAELDALKGQLVRLTRDMEAIRDQNSTLRGLRQRYTPAGVRIMPARVLARDIDPQRDALLLSRGSGISDGQSRGRVQLNDSVASHWFEIDAGANADTIIDHLVIAREVLLGKIAHVDPWTSRVQLFSDPGASTEVRIGRVITNAEGRAEYRQFDYPCILIGRGQGEMAIESVPKKYVSVEPDADDENLFRVGDYVISQPAVRELATPMVIGQITSFEEDFKKRLVVTIHARVPIDAIDEVFIIQAPQNRQ